MKTILDLCLLEKKRQYETINLIASENYVSAEILKIIGSELTNKYAEGYPHARYYSGCSVIDEIEQTGIDLGKKLFGAEYFNVQPHSGSDANFAAYVSQLAPHEKILGMSLSAGGHLTHGHSLNFSGKFFTVIPYGVDRETELIDYTSLEVLTEKHRPRMIIVGASAYSRIIDYQKISEIAHRYNALLCADIAHVAGLIAANVHPSPTPHADIVTGTTHKTLRGPRGGFVYAKKPFGKALDKAVMPGLQGGPHMNSIAAKAACFYQALQPAFKEYQQKVLENTQIMAKTFMNLGYRIVSGGTDTHLFLVDVSSKHSITGKQAEGVLEQCGILVNRNLIPFDTLSPLHTSGIRIGTPAITTRGIEQAHAERIVELIHEALLNRGDESFLKNIKNEAYSLITQFPLP